MRHDSRTHKVARTLLGLLFLTTGLNGFMGFLPMPEQPPEGAEFLGTLAASGLLGVIKTLEIAAGLLLLFGWREVFALVLIGPVVVNIMLYHLMLAPSTMALGLVAFTLWAFLFAGHWPVFRVLLTRKPERRVRTGASLQKAA